MRILIAEDEYYARKALEQNIRDWDQDAEVESVDNGIRALERLRKGDVDILLLDIKMPQMDGLALSSELLQEGIDVYTIITSGYSEFDFVRQALKTGAKEYLLKPINSDMLCEALESAYDEVSRRERTSRFDRENLVRRQQMRATNAWLQNPAGGCPDALREALQCARGCFCAAVFNTSAERAASILTNRLAELNLSVQPYATEENEFGALVLTPSASIQPDEIALNLVHALPPTARIVISDTFSLENAGEAYRQAQALYSIRCLEDGPVLTGDILKRRAEYVDVQEGDQGKLLFYHLIQRREQEAANSLLALLCPLMETPTASPYCIQDVLNHICAQINRASAQLSQETALGEAVGVTLRLEDIDRRENLYDRLRQLIHAACQAQGAEKISHREEIVALIRDYIKSVFFFPTMISAVAVALIWDQMFYRAWPTVMGLLGFQDVTSPLSNPTSAFIAVVFVNMWQAICIPTVIFMAGLQSIPSELYESAVIDGATRTQQFRYITLPHLMPMVTVNGILALKSGITAFDYAFAMTGGGPARATMLIGIMIYDNAFQASRYSRACAEAVTLFVIIAVLSAVQTLISSRNEVSGR